MTMLLRHLHRVIQPCVIVPFFTLTHWCGEFCFSPVTFRLIKNAGYFSVCSSGLHFLLSVLFWSDCCFRQSMVPADQQSPPTIPLSSVSVLSHGLHRDSKKNRSVRSDLFLWERISSTVTTMFLIFQVNCPSSQIRRESTEYIPISHVD